MLDKDSLRVKFEMLDPELVLVSSIPNPTFRQSVSSFSTPTQ